MKFSALFVLTISTALVLSGCLPKASKDAEKTETETTKTATVENETNEKYQVYSAGAVPEGKKMVLFFHADWCKTCKAWEKNLIDNVEALPENALIFKVDYDKETELRAKYGITKQSAAVFIDESGRVRKTSMDPSVDAVAYFFNQETPKEEVKVDPNKDKYQSYSTERLNGQKVALFFHADWCATCRKWESDLKANLSQLPENARVLKADYDTMKELVKDYGVTKQSTVVFLDEKGNVTKKLMDPSIEKVAEFFGAQVKVQQKEVVKKEKKKVKKLEVEEKEDEMVEEESKSERKEQDNNEEKVSDNQDSTNNDEKDVAPEKTIEEVSAPRYDVYSAEAVKAAEGQKYILNFSASWCPNCRKLDSELNGMLSTLPDGTLIFKADYDKYTDLKKKYGVTRQTTLVLVNADGTHEVKTGGSLGDIKNFFN